MCEALRRPSLELGPILESLDAKHGLFAVLGNYDHFRGACIVLAGLRRASIPILMNEDRTLRGTLAPSRLVPCPESVDAP
jgi:hypothetical protein